MLSAETANLPARTVGAAARHAFAPRNDIREWAAAQPGVGLLHGERPSFALALGWQVVLTLAGYRVHNIDGANRCNVFHLAAECMARSLPVEDVLQRVVVQRVFTPYQVLDVVQQVFEEASRNRRRRAKNESLESGEEGETVYFFMAPCKQFFDGDVGEEEGEFLLGRLLNLFAAMSRRGLPVIIVEREYDHPVFRRLQPRLSQLAACRWSLAALQAGGYTPPPVSAPDQYGDRFGRMAAEQLSGEQLSGELAYGSYSGSLFHAD